MPVISVAYSFVKRSVYTLTENTVKLNLKNNFSYGECIEISLKDIETDQIFNILLHHDHIWYTYISGKTKLEWVEFLSNQKAFFAFFTPLQRH